MATESFWRTCCHTWRGSEHFPDCVNFEPPLTDEERRWLRQYVFTHGKLPKPGMS